VLVQNHRVLHWLLVSALLLPAFSDPGHSQTANDGDQRPIGGLTFYDEYRLTIANVVVHVTDKKGNAINDLTKDDFEVLQDGEQQRITNFQLYTEEIIRSQLATQDAIVVGPTPTPAADTPPDPVDVYVVLFIDNENLDPLDRNRVLSQTRAFIQESLHPPAQMMVVSYRNSLKVLQPFTSNPKLVLDALRSVRKNTGGRTDRDLERRDIMDKIREYREEERMNPSYSDQDLGQYHQVYRLISGYAKEEANALVFTLDALRHVITTMSGLPGKKSLVYISNGLPMIPGMDLFTEASKVYTDFAALNELFTYDRSRLYQQLASTANAQDVTLYTISAAGVEMGGMGAAEHQHMQDPLSASVGSRNYSDSLEYMAEETGGIAIVNTNDVGPWLERVSQDMYTYYSIGYPLQQSGKDKVHSIKVTVPGHPEYRLRYRQRLVEKSRETQVQDRVVSSLTFEVHDNPMDIEVTTGKPAPATENRWLVPAHITFPLRNLALLPEGDEFVGRLVLFVAARDDDGKRSDLMRQEHEVRLPAADYEIAQSQRFAIDTTLLMEAGTYRVAVALLDQVTRQDSYETTGASVHPELAK
jgi:VWFA-related protein